MGLERRKRSKQFLGKRRVNVETTDDAFFGVYDLPPYFGEGKNTFRIKPTGLAKGSKIDIEIIDANGNPVYWEVPTHKSVDKSRVVSVWIYDGTDTDYVTPDGKLDIIITGRDSRRRTVRYKKTVRVQKSRTSTSEIIFKSDNLPTLTVSSSVETFVNIPSSDNVVTQVTQSNQVKYIKSIYGDTVSYEQTSLPLFNGEMISGSIEIDLSGTTLFPRLTGQAQPTSVTHSITNVLTTKILQVDAPITQSDNRDSDSIHTYEYSDGSVTATIRYQSTGSNATTQNQVAIANITISNVNPIAGRIDSVNTLIKSDGLSASEFELISNVKVANTSTIDYKVTIPTEHLDDPKTLKIQFLNSAGDVSTTELIISGIVFTGGNVYIGGTQSLITGSIFVSNAIGSGIEIGGASSGFLKSVGYIGLTSASSGNGPGGFIIYSGSGGLQMGADVLEGVGLQFVGDNDDRHLLFTTANGGELDIKTDKFFIGTTGSQFISGSDSNIEISSSLFHLDPRNDSLVIGADATILADLTANNIRTPAQINGAASTDLNASSSIKSDGFARFVSASIGGWDITPQSIEGGNLIMQPEGILKTKDYQSNLKGWIISSENNGFAEFENVKIRGTLSTTTFEKESVNAVGGQLYVANSTTISGSYSSSIDTVNTPVSASFTNSSAVDPGVSSIFVNNFTEITSLGKTDSDIVGVNLNVSFSGTHPDDPNEPFFQNGTNVATAQYFNTGPDRLTLTGGDLVTETLSELDAGSTFVVSFASSSIISSSFEFPNVSPSSSTFIVDNVTGFAEGEILTIKKVTDTGFSTEYVRVHSTERVNGGSDSDLSGRLTVTRSYGEGLTGDSSSLGDLPSMSQSYEEGQVIVSTGKIGSGYIRINANPNDSSTPYIDIVERTGSGLYDVELKARLGDLSGLDGNSIVLNKSNPGFGLATDNVYLKGGISATFGDIGGFGITSTAISSSNNNLILKDTGEITGSSVLFDGGIIGGLEITSSAIQSTTNLASPDSNPSYKVTNSGVISGSNLYIRKVTDLGDGDETVVLLDTEIGIIDARNNGRQVVSDNNQYYRFDTDDDSSTYEVASHVFHLLPYENVLSVAGIFNCIMKLATHLIGYRKP